MSWKYLIVSILLAFVVGIAGGIVALKYYPKLASEFPSVFPELTLISEGNADTATQVVSKRDQTITSTVEEVSPSVVSVVLKKNVPVFERQEGIFPQYEKKGTEERKVGGGTGFIISSDGLIVTNKHVVQEKNVDYTVILNNEEKYSAEVLARDPIKDLAILKIEEDNLPVVELGNSSKIEVGQTAIAIGYALGRFENTVSTGVISGLARDVVASGKSITEEFKGLIQTDAAINPGNSGGPLLNLEGKVVGINVARGEGQNIGFAIPINDVKKAIKEFKKEGSISYPFLGINYLSINQEIQEKYNLSVPYGALVVRDENGVAVIPGSAADKAGLKAGDIILEVEGEKATDNLQELILKYEVGEEIKLKILRKGEKQEVKVTLGKR